MTIMAENIPVARFEELLADESVPVVHRALWVLLWESDARVLDLLALEVADVGPDAREIRPAGEPLPVSERAAFFLRRLREDRSAGPLFAVGSRALTWDQAVRAAQSAGHAIHAFRTSGRQHRGGSR